MHAITVRGKMLAVNEDGYLADAGEWTPEVASFIAAVEGIELTKDHWAVLHFLREYYQQYKVAPKIKLLAKEMGGKLGHDAEQARKHLYNLYPCGPAVQACKIAGLPRPTGCV